MLIGTLCVMDATMNSRFEDVAESQSQDDLIGNDLLKSQADTLNKLRHAARKGEDMESVDNMLHGFQAQTQAHTYDSLTEALEKQAPKQDDLDVALAPGPDGLVHYNSLAPKKAISAIPDFSEDLEFMQAPEDWTPSGQGGLSDTINDMKAADEEEALKEDHLQGHSVLSAIGITEDEDDTPLFSLVQTDATWEPEGQAGMSDAIKQSKAQAQESEDKENGFKGESVLSAVGITQDAADDVENADFSDEELGLSLVQVDATADWVPAGQPGLSGAIQHRKDDDEATEMKEDGLKGHSILSAVGAQDEEDEDDETMFIQDQVADWKPKGQKVGSSQTYENTKEKKQEMPEWTEDDGLEGDNLLSAVGMGGFSSKDEAADLGMLKDEDLDLDLV